MEQLTGTSVLRHGNLGLGSSFAAGALMLCHMNSQGVGRYDKLIADLSRLHAETARVTPAHQVTAPVSKKRSSWVRWLYR